MSRSPILVIDDDPLFCEFVCEVLREARHDVLSAPDGPAGIELARAARPAVIILDMMMPRMDGIATCQRLKQDPVIKDTPVIGVTASLELRYAEEAYRAGAEFFLTKPLAAENLVYVVRMALEKAQPNTVMRPRLYARFRAHLPVWCLLRGDQGSSREVDGYTGDVGSAGALIWLPEIVIPGTLFRLRLVLPTGEVAADGQVIWQDYSAGFATTPHGVRFLRFAQEADQIKYKRFLFDLTEKWRIY